MEFPSFAEFLATIDLDTIAGIMQDAKKTADTIDPAASLDTWESLPIRIQSLCWQTSLELLAVYHEWLRQQC